MNKQIAKTLSKTKFLANTYHSPRIHTYHIIIDFGILYEGKSWKNNDLELLSQKRTFLSVDFHKPSLDMLLR